MKLNAKYHFCLFPEKKGKSYGLISSFLLIERINIIYKSANNHEICLKIKMYNEDYENIENTLCR